MKGNYPQQRRSWPGVKEAAALLGVSYGHLLLCLKGERSSPDLVRRYQEISAQMNQPNPTAKYSPAFQRKLLKALSECQALLDIANARLKAVQGAALEVQPDTSTVEVDQAEQQVNPQQPDPAAPACPAADF
jgi:hypothetical protein